MIRKPNGEVEFTPDEEAEMIKCEYENYCAWYDSLTPEEQAAEDEFHRKSLEGKI